MPKESIVKIIRINIIFLIIFLELASRIILHLKKNEFEKNFLSQENKEYLGYVNHMRDRKHIELFKKAKSKNPNIKYPLNFNDKSFFSYGILSLCADHLKKDKNQSWLTFIKESKCPQMLMQGDSWGEGIARHGQNLFKKFNNQNWNIILGGTSSFSLANYSGQLAFLNSKGISPKIIFLNLEQTDLGDDYLRYKDHITIHTKPISHAKVKNFGFDYHRSFYNNYPYLPLNEIPDLLSLKPHSIVFSKALLIKYINQIKYKTNRKIDFSRTVTWTKLSQTLVKKDKKAVENFKKLLKLYISTARESGVKELFITSHPHYKHLYKKDSFEDSYSYNISDTIDQFLKLNQINNSRFKVFHIRFPNDKISCPNITCNGYFEKNDNSSHPTDSGYKIFSEFIRNEFLKKSNLSSKKL